MNISDTAREAVFIEALGGLSELIDRLQAICPAVEDSRQALIDAHAELGEQLSDRLSAFALQLGTMSHTAKDQIVKAVVTHVDVAARRTVEKQKQELRETAHALFGEQVRLAIQNLAIASQRMAEQRASMRYLWLGHAVMGCATFALSWSLPRWIG